jgi:hypothetical protein
VTSPPWSACTWRPAFGGIPNEEELTLPPES